MKAPHANGLPPKPPVFSVNDACMAWLMKALSQAPALTDEQLHRARRRLAQP
jgi:hypothetical protein